MDCWKPWSSIWGILKRNPKELFSRTTSYRYLEEDIYRKEMVILRQNSREKNPRGGQNKDYSWVMREGIDKGGEHFRKSKQHRQFHLALWIGRTWACLTRGTLLLDIWSDCESVCQKGAHNPIETTHKGFHVLNFLGNSKYIHASNFYLWKIETVYKYIFDKNGTENKQTPLQNSKINNILSSIFLLSM